MNFPQNATANIRSCFRLDRCAQMSEKFQNLFDNLKCVHNKKKTHTHFICRTSNLFDLLVIDPFFSLCRSLSLPLKCEVKKMLTVIFILWTCVLLLKTTHATN